MSGPVVNKNLLVFQAQFQWGGTFSARVPYLALFVNNITPNCADTLTSYTKCSLTGYADVALAYANWVYDTTTCVITTTYPTITWTLTSGGQTIYGHFYYDNTSGEVYAAYLWPTPYAVPGGGGSVSITPQWTFNQC